VGTFEEDLAELFKEDVKIWERPKTHDKLKMTDQMVGLENA